MSFPSLPYPVGTVGPFLSLLEVHELVQATDGTSEQSFRSSANREHDAALPTVGSLIPSWGLLAPLACRVGPVSSCSGNVVDTI